MTDDVTRDALEVAAAALAIVPISEDLDVEWQVTSALIKVRAALYGTEPCYPWPEDWPT